MGEITVNEGVVLAEDGGEAFLLHTMTRRYYRLNPAGLVLWRALESGADPHAALRGAFPALPGDQAARDAMAFVEALERAGLARRAPSD